MTGYVDEVHLLRARVALVEEQLAAVQRQYHLLRVQNDVLTLIMRYLTGTPALPRVPIADGRAVVGGVPFTAGPVARPGRAPGP